MSRDLSGIQDRRGIIIFTIVTNVFGAATTTLLVFPEERKVFLRERSNGLYRVISYILGKSIAEIPVFFISSCIFGVLLYWSSFMNDTFSYKYYTYLGLLIMSCLVGTSFAFVLSSLVKDQETLITLNSAISVPLLLLSGFFANEDNFAPYLIPFKYLSVFKYTYQSLIHIEFTYIQPFNCFNTMQCVNYIQENTFVEPFYVSVIAIFALYFLFKILSFIFLYYFNKIKV
jgi:hypothetical protein